MLITKLWLHRPWHDSEITIRRLLHPFVDMFSTVSSHLESVSQLSQVPFEML